MHAMLSAVAMQRRSLDSASIILLEALLCKLIACSVIVDSQPFRSNCDFSIKLPLLEPEHFQSLAPPAACSSVVFDPAAAADWLPTAQTLAYLGCVPAVSASSL